LPVRFPKDFLKGDTFTVFTSWHLLSPKNGAPHKMNINTVKRSSQAFFVAVQHNQFSTPLRLKNAMIIKHLVFRV
jgi:hypothetical protein